MYSHVAASLGAESVMLGADWNGGMKHLARSCRTATSLDEDAGLYHIGQERELWEALKRLGAPVPKRGAALERFLQAWERAEQSRLSPPFGSELPELHERRDARGPGGELRVGAGIGTAEGGQPGVGLWLEGRVLKDSATAVPSEPLVYFVDSRLHVTHALDGDVPYVELRTAGLGIGAERLDNRAYLEAPVIRISRRVPLDEAWRLRAASLSGGAGAMFLQSPERQHLFAALSTELLGYEHLDYRSDSAAVNGLYLAGATGRLGFMLYASDDAALRLEGTASTALTLFFPSADATVATLTDVDLGGGGSIVLSSSGVELFLRSGWQWSRDDDDGRSRSAMRTAGGVLLTLF
jgi:hypothetical protein